MSRRALRLIVLLALALLLPGRPARALTNGLALLPPMGFNSFYSYGAGINETIIKSIADAFATNGLTAAGYTYINVDDGWAGLRDTNGVMVADTNKFPGGIKALADYMHARGLKLGLYTTASTNTCADFPGSANHVVQDANTYAAWGVDYLKYEGCQIPSYKIYPRQQIYIARMAQALALCGRPIVFSSSIGGSFENWMPQYINLWRGTGDINGNWQTVLDHIDFVAQTPAAAGPGAWNDPDVLEIGSGAFQDPQAKAFFSMWCILASPLLVLGPETTHTNILCNPEAIAVDQDPAGIQGVCVASNNNHQVWRKPLGGANATTLAVALFNRDGAAANLTANWGDLGYAPGVATVWDMWAHAYVGIFTNSYGANIPGRGVQLLKFVPGATIPLPPVGTNYVSDLPWLSDVTNETVLPNNIPYFKDHSGPTQPLSLRGTSYSKGLGMDGYTFVRYFLGGMATRFQSDIGIDDRAAPFGSMIFRVYGDGMKLYESGALTPQSPVQSLDLNVAGYMNLTLEVADANDIRINEYADWGGARITFAALPPAIPGGLSATPSANQFALSWYAVVGTTNYYLKRATAPGGPYTVIATNAAPVYTDTNIAPGLTYFYVVAAGNAYGQSTNSVEIDAALPAYWTNTLTAVAQSWNVNGNWTNPAAFPNRAGALAVVSPALVSNQTINLNQGITLGALVLGVTNGPAALTLAANGGTLTFDDGAASATLTDLASGAGDNLSAPLVLTHNLAVNSRSTNFLTLAGNISGPGSLTANGPGPLLLSGSNSFAGTVTVNAGLVKLGHAAALGGSASNVIVAGLAALDLNGFNLGGRPFIVSGAGADGNGVLRSTAVAPQTNALRFVTLAGDTVLGGTGRWDIRGSNSLAASGTLSTGGKPFNVTKTGSNQISLASLTIDPALGNLDIQQGVLGVENATSSLGDPAAYLSVEAGATLAFNQTTNAWDKVFVFYGDGVTPSVISSGGTNTLIGNVIFSDNCVINVTAGTLAFNGPLDGYTSLVKNSGGTLAFGGTNSGDLEGDILVNGGTLLIQNAGAISLSSTITIAPGAVLDVSALNFGLALHSYQALGGGGMVRGGVNVGAQAAVKPANAFGVLTFSNSLTFLPGAICELAVATSPGLINEQLQVLGNLEYAGTLAVSNAAGDVLLNGDHFKLFAAASYSGAFDNILPQIPGDGVVWDTSQLAVSGTLFVKTGNLPRFTGFSSQGGSVQLSGLGTGNASYHLLATTNLSLPAAQWMRVATNHFDSQGHFSVTNTPDPNARVVYYRLEEF